MTDELKTLKDLERKYWIDKTGIPLIAVDIPTLKAEAIKWVKYLEKKECVLINEKLTLLNWIKYFFNITKEDLE